MLGREVFNALRYLVRAGCPWRLILHDLPPWEMVYQQAQRWIKAEVFEAMCHDLRALVRAQAGRDAQPSAVIFDGRTLQSTPESGERAGYDGYKKKNGSKTHIAVDTLGNLLALHVTPANEGERDQVDTLCEEVQAVTGGKVEHAFVSSNRHTLSAAPVARRKLWRCSRRSPTGSRSSGHPLRSGPVRSTAWAPRLSTG